MTNSKFEIIDEGLLTVPIDSDTGEFREFQQLLKSKVDGLSIDQLNTIKLQSLRFKMLDYLESEVNSKGIIETGSFLRQVLSELNIKQNRFAEYLSIKPSNLSKLLKGERSISLEMSIILEEVFGIESKIWSGIQAKNKLLKISRTELRSLKKFKLKDLLPLEDSI